MRKKTLEPIERTAVAKGYGSFLGEIKSKDNKEVRIIAHNREFTPEESKKNSFYDVPIKEKTDRYWDRING